jgi:5-methylcytosine-specific restriction protein A
LIWQPHHDRDLPPGWAKLRRTILKRDHYVCQIQGPYCYQRATEVDHIAGSDDHRAENLRAVCQKCHATKSSREGHAAKAAKRQGPRKAE